MKKEELTKLMLGWQGRITPVAASLLSNLFDSADEVLIEYAEKAESNAVQAKFLEGGRELRLKQKEVSGLFTEHLARDIFEFLRPIPRADAPGAEVLSLVSKDSYERSLALNTICEQVIKKHQELYFALSQRLGVVSGGPAISYEYLPAGPHQLARVFEGAAGILVIERRVLLVLYMLFEREVIRESPAWHHELNEDLRKGGILPNLKYELKLDPSQRRRKRSRDSEQQEQTPGGDTTGRQQNSGGAPISRRGQAGVDSGIAAGGWIDFGDEGHTAQADFAPAREAALPKYSGLPESAEADAAPSPSSVTPMPGDYFADPGAPRSNDPLYSGVSEGTQGLGDQLLGRIRDLLVAQRSRQPQGGGAARPEPAFPASAASVAATIDSQRVQQHAIPETGVFQGGAQRVVVTRELLEKLRTALAKQRLIIKESVGQDKLSHFDEDTIDIVGMLFEVMLNDGRLNNTVKALLSHLHTPYLKLAVRDRVFLRNREHPARQLLDNMVEAGSRWVDERDLTKGIYPRLQRLVDLVMKAGDYPLALIQELNEGLSADIRLRSERQQVREVRTVEAEKGKARLDEARIEATRATRQFLSEEGAPARFQEFIDGPWTDYMTLLYLRSNGNTDTTMWRGAQTLCTRLARSVERLGKGKRPSDRELEVLHAELSQRLGDAIPHYETKVEHLFELFHEDHEIAIVAPSPIPEPEKPFQVALSVDGSALLERLPKLPSGSWVVFHEHDGDRVVKLSWFNPKTDRFLFVDQAGAKALVVPLKKLADQIDRKKAHVLLATGASYVESSLERALNTLEKRSS